MPSGASERRHIRISDEENRHVTAVLKRLSRGAYPAEAALPVALNVYSRQRTLEHRTPRPAVYFYPEITPVPQHASAYSRSPTIALDDAVLDDLELPWRDLKDWPAAPVRSSLPAGQGAGSESSSRSHPDAESRSSGAADSPTTRGPGIRLGAGPEAATARYRLLCILHKHRFAAPRGGGGGGGAKSVYTISIFDRDFFIHEPGRMVHHDVYPHQRPQRRLYLKNYWRQVRTPGAGFAAPRPAFVGARLGFRGRQYGACGAVEAALRTRAAPGVSLWGVLGIALTHVHRAREQLYGVVAPTLANLGATAPDQIPRFWAALLGLAVLRWRARYYYYRRRRRRRRAVGSEGSWSSPRAAGSKGRREATVGTGGGGGVHGEEEEEEEEEEDGEYGGDSDDTAEEDDDGTEAAGFVLPHVGKRPIDADERRELGGFLQQFRIVERVDWMKEPSRKFMEQEAGQIWGQAGVPQWVYDELRMYTQ
ncbi:hypothetical protein F4780DRAFT_785311 [Xylariomycetidae sp. FL0641]|nr:hypothetical protein F4780DRAFT_788711 [Xylariomycetidae sp. FL0641]KAI0026158.1 hypothetical protein F4780DRAFT_785311 [Xylariomycetidae sp. FL0641]